MLITKIILLVDNMWLNPSQLRVTEREKQPKRLLTLLQEKNALKWLTFPKVIRPRDGFFCFKIAFLLTWHMVSITARPWPQRHFKSLWKMWFYVNCSVVCHRGQLKFCWMRGRGVKGGSRDLIHAIPLYDMTRFVTETFSLLVSLFHLTNHLMLTRDSEHTSLYHV